jgi:polyisoprenoid-binding protein YceI
LRKRREWDRRPAFASFPTIFVLAVSLIAAAAPAASQVVTLQADPQHTSVNFTLKDVLHTVRGTFRAERGSLQFDPGTNKISGEVVVNAKSGESGSTMRDRKMHREVLESDRYPEIVFRPDRVDGAVKTQGKSSVQVHGIFVLHGNEREMTVPAEVEMSADHWSAILHFELPYGNWGIKNPSTLFLKVGDTVQIDIDATGSVVQH